MPPRRLAPFEPESLSSSNLSRSCPLCVVISTGRRNTGGQLAINNDGGLANARPIAFSESLRNQLSPQRNFLCRPRTTTKSLTYRPIIDLFPLR
jgi:hypothetical protein